MLIKRGVVEITGLFSGQEGESDESSSFVNDWKDGGLGDELNDPSEEDKDKEDGDE